jgi:hypothetical protein
LKIFNYPQACQPASPKVRQGFKPLANSESPLKLTSCTILNKPFTGGQDAHPTRKSILCGTGILPVPDNGARSELKLTSCSNVNKGIFRGALAGLYNLFATFLTVGEPAPTGLLRMVPDLS